MNTGNSFEYVWQHKGRCTDFLNLGIFSKISSCCFKLKDTEFMFCKNTKRFYYLDDLNWNEITVNLEDILIGLSKAQQEIIIFNLDLFRSSK